MQEYLAFAARHPVLISIFIAILMLIIIGEFRRKAGSAKSLSSVALTQLINDDNCVVVDVRPSAEYKQGHIVGAKSLLFSEVQEKGDRLSKDKDVPLVVYCRNGTQSPTAANQLKALGYTQVHTLSGGLMTWEADNMPLEK